MVVRTQPCLIKLLLLLMLLLLLLSLATQHCTSTTTTSRRRHHHPATPHTCHAQQLRVKPDALNRIHQQLRRVRVALKHHLGCGCGGAACGLVSVSGRAVI